MRLADLEGRRPPIDTHPLEVHQRGEVLQRNAERAVPVAEGSYRWRGELRLWDNEALIGWYRRSVASGWGAMARSEDQAHQVVLDLINDGRP